MTNNKIFISKGYTLFIDRDGVINKEKKEDYIYTWEEFEFLEGVLEGLKICNHFFDNIILITNQRGIGRGLMTHQNLETLHTKMLEVIKTNGGRIDAIYYCADDDNNSPNRKPNPGMAFKAVKDYPHINLQKTLMVGNRISDMKFARNAGVQSVFVATTHPEIAYPHEAIDYRFDNLLAFAKALTKS
ncbi:MAG: D-glycero-alpha-D-manno-heptose-1,7-bisphosphate 7-phosphatase [Chitinophagaceae bacterium]